MIRCLAEHFPIRAMDLRQPEEGAWESMAGDVTKLDDAMTLCAGCSDLVIAHMAPNRPEIYGTPEIPFDVNVKGAANLFHAAACNSLHRVVLISSTGAIAWYVKEDMFLTRDMPGHPNSMYGLTKQLQEKIAEYFHLQTGIGVAVLRPAHICDEDTLIDKYDKRLTHTNWVMIDPRDIAEAVRLSLVAPKLDYEVFYVLGHPDSETRADVRYTRNFLGWRPRHTFEKYSGDRRPTVEREPSAT